MLETLNFQSDQELHQLEVETFEIEDLAEAEQIAAGSSSSTSSTSSTTSSTSTVSCSC